MEYCPKCGNKVDDTMTFCPRCGNSLKMETTPSTPPPYDYRYRYRRRDEKNEKNEKPEKRDEKHEKPGGSYVGMLIAGLVILFLGALAFVNATSPVLNEPLTAALVLVVIGIIIVVAGIYYSTTVRKRNPAPS